MLKIFQKFSLNNFKEVLIGIWRRTPLSALVALSSFFILFTLIRVEDMSETLENKLIKAFITLSLVFFFSISVYYFAESKKFNNSSKWLLQISTLVFGILFYLFFEENLVDGPETETVVYVVLTQLGIVSFLFISQFFQKFKVKVVGQNDFYASSYSFVIRILMAGIVGIVSMLLGFIALSSIFTLFDIEFIEEENWYGYWSAFTLALFAPYFLLANLPKINEGEPRETVGIRENKFYSFLINFVGLPAIIIYFLILYAYIIKVLINFKDWPQGEVTWMVILFSFFGYLIYFASFIFASTFKIVHVFRKILPMAILLQTFMLFYAIWLRINQYDFTINRYLVVVFGFWLFGISIYYNISRKKDLSILFYSLLVVVIVISIGPWSVYLFPENRQLNNLEKNLKEAGILLDNGEIETLEKYDDIEKRLSGEIYGGINYLINYHGKATIEGIFQKEIDVINNNHKEEWEKSKRKRLEELVGGDEDDIKRVEDWEYDEIENWDLRQKLTETIKVKDYSIYDLEESVPREIRFKIKEDIIMIKILRWEVMMFWLI